MYIIVLTKYGTDKKMVVPIGETMLVERTDSDKEPTVVVTDDRIFKVSESPDEIEIILKRMFKRLHGEDDLDILDYKEDY